MNVPQSREGWQALSEDELFTVALSGQSGATQHEISRRLIVALREFKESADRSSRSLVLLTRVLVLLTGAILALTVVLAIDAL